MAGDLYWNNVVLAMHMDDTGLTDVKGHAVTLNGNAARSSTQSKFGGYSAAFDGSGDYLSIPTSTDFDLTGDFTIEGWIRITDVIGTGNGRAIITRGWSSGVYVPFLLLQMPTTGNINFYAWSTGTTWNVVNGFTLIASPTTGTWYHIAVSRSGSYFRFFVNGSLVGLVVSATALPTSSNSVYIGGTTTAADCFNGYIDDLRITKGVARYTESFTAPTAAFIDVSTAVSGTVKDASNALASRLVRAFRRDTGALIGTALSDATTGAYSIPTSYGGEHFVMAHDTNDADPYWDKVVLACHFDGVPDNGDTYRNNVVLNIRGNDGLDDTGKTLTYAGNAQISTAQFKYGTASLYFDGTGDYLTAPDSSDLAFGTKDFTVESWVYVTSFANQPVLVDTRQAAAGAGAAFYFNTSGYPVYYASSAIRLTSTIAVSLNTWTHVAFVRVSGVTKIYVDGVESGGTYADTLDITQYGCTIGSTIDYRTTASAYHFSGYIDDLRITKGVARYTAAFTPPAAELPAISGTRFKDSSSTAKTLTPNGDVVISLTQSKFGGYSAAFDGSGDYLSLADTDDFALAGSDFTLECWVYPTAYPSSSGGFYEAALVAKDLASNREYNWRLTGTASSFTGVQFTGFTGGTPTTITGTYAFALNTWYHVAVVRYGNTITHYVNGVVVGTGTLSITIQNLGAALRIGSHEYDATYKYALTGYIDDLRITKGVARYTANFTAPTAAFKETPNGGTENAVILDRIVPV